MEAALVVVALLVLLGGAVALLSRQGMLPRGLPAPRLPAVSGAGSPQAEGDSGHDVTHAARPVPVGEPSLVTSLPTARLVSPTRTHPDVKGTAANDPVRLEVDPVANDAIASRLDRIDERLDALQRSLVRQNDAYTADTKRVATELLARMDAENARQDAAQERLRADLISALARIDGATRRDAGNRRLEVSAELYARLARLEAALATVTNPVLLPGEAYAPPAEFLPETLIWENWNEVGERAFALADGFSAQRLHLSEQTRADVGSFVASLRALLTQSVYPNLQVEPDRARQATLRAALDEIATELPKVRETLEREYRAGESA